MPQENKIKPAKVCYSHIGGKLGALLMETFINKGWIEKMAPDDKHYHITKEGAAGFKRMGIDLSRITDE